MNMNMSMSVMRQRCTFGYLFVCVLLIVILTTPARALEVYSVLTKDCELTEGLIIGMDSSRIDVLTLKGQYKSVLQDDLRYLAIYNTIDNPIEKLSSHPRLARALLEVYVDDQKSPLFIGWPVKFVENLVIFYDLQGKSHVFELYKIRKLRPYFEESIKSDRLEFQPVSLSYKSWVTQCQLPESKAGEFVRPTRVIGDQIQISEFLSQMEEGFENVKSFQERTYVYSRPFLFDRQTRLGFLVFDKDNYVLSPSAPFPMYFQWTKGREFRFQSFNQIGSVPIEYLPTVEPLMIFRSDLKSHVFHASFVGNLEALSAGTEYFTPIMAGGGGDASKSRRPYDSSKPGFKAHSAASINYMALMGGDWGPWSVSAGTYFPNFMVQAGDNFREILASKLAPLFRLMYTKKNFRLRGILGFTKLDQSDEVQDSQISRDSELSVVGYLNQFSFSSHYLRTGVDYRFSPEIEVSLDQLWLTASYEETLSTAEKNNFDFSHLVTQASIRHSFGDYVALRAYLHLFQINQDFRFFGRSESEKLNHVAYGGTFEFIF
jgi:hypothetical protein